MTVMVTLMVNAISAGPLLKMIGLTKLSDDKEAMVELTPSP